MNIPKETLTWKQRLVGFGIVGLVVFVVTGFGRLGDRDFNRVSMVSYVASPTSKATENMIADATAPSGYAGEYGVNMTGKVHDGYLELHIKRESRLETQIIPLERIYVLTFSEE